MDLTQIALGIGLLTVSSLTFLEPSGLDPAVRSVLTGAALLVGAGVVFATVARDARP